MSRRQVCHCCVGEARDFCCQICDRGDTVAAFVKPTILKETNVGYAASSGAPMPPAGDVEVLLDEDTLRDLSSSACQSALCDGINEEAFTRLARTVEQRCRERVTRVAAERRVVLTCANCSSDVDPNALMISLKDHKIGQAALLEHIESLKADRTRLTAERDQQRKLKMILAERVTNAEANCSVYRVQLEALESELTKARELLTDVKEFLAYPDANLMDEVNAFLAIPTAHNVDESCGQDAECNYCGGDGYHAAPQTPGTTCDACNGSGQDADAANICQRVGCSHEICGHDADAAKGVFNDPLYNAESDARNAAAMLEEVLEFYDDGVGRSAEEFKLMRKIGDWLGRSVPEIEHGADECAHSEANKIGCPECGKEFKA